MRYVLLVISALFATAIAIADTCTPSGDGYTRSYRPQGYTPVNAPITDPRCQPFARDTNASNTPLCGMCHPHLYAMPGRIG